METELFFSIFFLYSSLDLDSIQKAIELFKGEHNFASFCTRNKANKDKSTVKTIDEFRISQCHPLSSFEQLNPLYSSIEFYEFYIKSKSFLYNQVRRMVGSALDVGIGRLTLSDIETMLAVPNHRPSLISEMVPACGKHKFVCPSNPLISPLSGLYLSEIGYLDEGELLFSDVIPKLLALPFRVISVILVLGYLLRIAKSIPCRVRLPH